MSDVTETRRTGWVHDERYLWHDATLPLGPWVQTGAALETPEGKRRLASLVAASGLLGQLVPLAPVALEEKDLTRFHEPGYVALVKQLSAGAGGMAGDHCHVGHGSYEIAALAAGGTWRALHAVIKGEADNAYALVRPAGHHAEADRGRGYCIFGNIALAVLKAREELGLRRVAVVDIDVHHGNGTEQAFWNDPDVLTVSLHQDRLYPEDSGSVEDRGGPSARGSVVNVPLPAGSGEGAYRAALDEVVLPTVAAFRPELVVVACGFDAGGLDPLGRMMLSSGAFGRIIASLLEVADEVCGGRLVLSHEGGYSDLHVPFCGMAVLQVMSGFDTGITDPFAWLDDDPHQSISETQRHAVARARALLPPQKAPRS